jgi:DNA-directed RNA polymerase subunit L
LFKSRYWKHPLLPEEPLTIPGKDGDDAPLYLERNIQRVLKKLEEIENEEGEE